MKKVLRIALKVNDSERTLLSRFAGVSRFAYNWGLSAWQERYSRGIRSDAMKLHKELNILKKTDFPWMKDVSKCAPQEALREHTRIFLRRELVIQPTRGRESPEILFD